MDLEAEGDGQQRRRCRRVHDYGIGEHTDAPGGAGGATVQDVHGHRHGPDEGEHVPKHGGRSYGPVEGDDGRTRYGDHDAKER